MAPLAPGLALVSAKGFKEVPGKYSAEKRYTSY